MDVASRHERRACGPGDRDGRGLLRGSSVADLAPDVLPPAVDRASDEPGAGERRAARHLERGRVEHDELGRAHGDDASDTERAGAVVPPALEGAARARVPCTDDGARVRAPGGDRRHAAQACDGHGRGRARERAVPELAARVEAPAVDPAVAEERARVVAAGRNRGDAGEPRVALARGDLRGRARRRQRTVAEAAVRVVAPALDDPAVGHERARVVRACRDRGHGGQARDGHRMGRRGRVRVTELAGPVVAPAIDLTRRRQRAGVGQPHDDLDRVEEPRDRHGGVRVHERLVAQGRGRVVPPASDRAAGQDHARAHIPGPDAHDGVAGDRGRPVPVVDRAQRGRGRRGLGEDADGVGAAIGERESEGTVGRDGQLVTGAVLKDDGRAAGEAGDRAGDGE